MMPPNIGEWCARVRQGMRSRYVCLLEAQVARERAEIEGLRAENRALLNSLLGTAGVPPIEAPPAHPAQIAPIRRRSWQQIFAAREIEAGREARAREQSAQRQPGD
ncbi:MAG: hypothetical protein DMG31_19500 [Acidobacteria bacterium]|nr:MAG: hypothetical protein DMG31_19500 [Acidobacteriota bacterium]